MSRVVPERRLSGLRRLSASDERTPRSRAHPGAMEPPTFGLPTFDPSLFDPPAPPPPPLPPAAGPPPSRGQRRRRGPAVALAAVTVVASGAAAYAGGRFGVDAAPPSAANTPVAARTVSTT